jgi:Fe-S cluster assembly protein SufD
VKGCVDGDARAVFNGLVSVPARSVKSVSEQSHHGLLLSRRARIDAKPELSIDCDDVQCRHGATVGALRQDAIFYLTSRGIEEKEAKSMLELAHVTSLLSAIENEPIKAYMEENLRRCHG